MFFDILRIFLILKSKKDGFFLVNLEFDRIDNRNIFFLRLFFGEFFRFCFRLDFSIIIRIFIFLDSNFYNGFLN